MRILGLFLVGILPWMACQGVDSNKGRFEQDSITEEDIAVAKELHQQYLVQTQPMLNDTVYRVQCMGKWVEVRFKVSKYEVGSGRKLLLLLPGWNYSDTQWCTRTTVCETALRRGYDVMFVEMGKSVYMDSLYPEMRKDYRLHPTRSWLWDSVLQPLQMRGYFTDKAIPETLTQTGSGKLFYRDLRLPIPTFVMGLSTGGRGAMLLGLEHPEAFRGVASLSGDYDPTLTPNDNLMINCMGSFSSFMYRWQGSNNIRRRISELQIPCFVAHGKVDPVVSVNQAIQLAAAYELVKTDMVLSKQSSPKSNNSEMVKTAQPKFICRIVENAGHDYTFWNQAGLEALDFFDSLNK